MLPTQKTAPRTSLSDLTIFVYGPHKFGKSEWCSNAGDALFLATEAGLNSLEVYQVPIRTWDELLVAAKDIADGKHSFRTVVLDTVDNAYKMCAEHICQKFKIEHESDLEYGKGYALINNEFYRVLNKLALLPYGLFLVSHSQEKEIETRTGKYTKIVPTLPDKARKLVLGMVDIILFCDIEQTTNADGKQAYRRVVRTKPSATYEAGDRTGRLPEVIDLNFATFVAAFAQGVAPRASQPATQTGTTTALASPAAPREASPAAPREASPAAPSEALPAAPSEAQPAALTPTSSTPRPPPVPSSEVRAAAAPVARTASRPNGPTSGTNSRPATPPTKPRTPPASR